MSPGHVRRATVNRVYRDQLPNVRVLHSMGVPLSLSHICTFKAMMVRFGRSNCWLNILPEFPHPLLSPSHSDHGE